MLFNSCACFVVCCTCAFRYCVFSIINVLFEFEIIRVLLIYKLLCLRSYVVHCFFESGNKSTKFTCTRIFIIRLGLRVSATCDSAERANRLAVRLAAEVSENDTTDIVGKETQNVFV